MVSRLMSRVCLCVALTFAVTTTLAPQIATAAKKRGKGKRKGKQKAAQEVPAEEAKPTSLTQVGPWVLFQWSTGGQVGKVLAGVSVPEGQDAAFTETLEKLGYVFSDETHNKIYLDFMR